MMIYKYQEIKRMVSENSRCKLVYSDPHADVIDFIRTNNINITMLSSFNMLGVMQMNPELIIRSFARGFDLSIDVFLTKMKNGIFNEDHWRILSRSNDSVILSFLEANPDIIDWYSLSENPSWDAIRILKNNPDKIIWDIISCNPSAIDMLENNPDKIDWTNICSNPNAIRIIEQNMHQIDFTTLSVNPNAIHIIEQNLNHICRHNLSFNPNAMQVLINHPELIVLDCILTNPNAISYLETQIEHMTINHIYKLARNPKGIPLIQKIYEEGRISSYDMSYITGELLRKNMSLYDLDYQEMSKIRTKLIYPELISKALNPSQIEKWLKYHCENGGSVEDFDLI